MNSSEIRLMTMNFLASNMSVFIVAGVCVVFLFFDVMIDREKSKNSQTIILPRARLIASCAACIFVFSLFCRLHFDAKEAIAWRNDVIEKAVSYTIYVDGIKVESENIDILSYSRNNIVIDNQAKTILIASKGV